MTAFTEGEQALIDSAGPAFIATDTARCFGAANALPLLRIEGTQCSALLSLQGGQLLSFTPRGQTDWLWLNPSQSFAPGQPIIGGVPICAPWFGLNHREPDKPIHGFVQQRRWQLLAVEHSPEQQRVTLAYQTSSADRPLFRWPFRVELSWSLGRELRVSWSIKNLAETAMPLSWAFHNYFAIKDLANARVSGLENRQFLDNRRGLQVDRQRGALSFDAAVDRVFESCGGEQAIIERRRRLCVGGVGCETVVLWQPGRDRAAIAAQWAGGAEDFLCLERGCAFADEIVLEAGRSHSAVMVVTAPGGARQSAESEQEQEQERTQEV